MLEGICYKHTRYTFHNVLWILWEDGVAYRCGLGRVVEEVWQEQGVEEIMLVLR